MNQTELNQDLGDAACKGDLPKIKELVSQGADVKAYSDYALRATAHNGYLEVVKYLVSQGADVRAYDDEALRWALKNEHLEVANFLKLAIKVQEGKGSRMDKALFEIMMKENNHEQNITK